MKNESKLAILWCAVFYCAMFFAWLFWTDDTLEIALHYAVGRYHRHNLPDTALKNMNDIRQSGLRGNAWRVEGFEYDPHENTVETEGR